MLELVIFAVIILILWIFSKSVKQVAKASEARVETLVVEATRDDIKRRAKAKFDLDTVIQAAENTQIANMALESNSDLLNKLRDKKAGGE